MHSRPQVSDTIFPWLLGEKMVTTSWEMFSSFKKNTSDLFIVCIEPYSQLGDHREIIGGLPLKQLCSWSISMNERVFIFIFCK